MIDWDKHPIMRNISMVLCFTFIASFGSLGFYMMYKVNNPTPMTKEEIKDSTVYKTLEAFRTVYEGYYEYSNNKKE